MSPDDRRRPAGSRRLTEVLGVVALCILAACSRGSDGESSDEADELHQIGTLAALSTGEYTGSATLDDLLEHGDFGLGTFDGLDGEMIVLDGVVHQVPASGIAAEADGGVTTPFAAVTTWDSDSRHEFPDPMSCTELQTGIDRLLDADAPYGVKVSGDFSTLLTRSVDSQTPPYQPLADALEGQVEFRLEQVTATMVGFRLPDYMAESNAAGFHFHALTEDERAGGHVLDCQTANVVVELDTIDTWQVELPPR
jgi:acetolactate decarboxylase